MATDHCGEYRGWMIVVTPYPLGNGFSARGEYRKAFATVTGLPMKIAFDTQQCHETEQSAVRAAFDWAKQKIDEDR